MSIFLTKKMKQSILSLSDRYDPSEDSYDSLLKEKDREIDRLSNLNTELHLKLEKQINETLCREKDSPNQKVLHDKFQEALELKYQSESDRKIEELKQKYEKLYLRTRKTLREKERECVLMEDEMKNNTKLMETLKNEKNETQRKIVQLTNEIELIKENEQSKENQILTLIEEKTKIFTSLNEEIENNRRELGEMKRQYEQSEEKRIFYQKEHEGFAEEKRDLEKVKELIMRRKDSLLAFQKVNTEKELENMKEELERMKKSKNLLEISMNNEIIRLREEKKSLELDLSVLKQEVHKYKEILADNDKDEDLHVKEQELEIARCFLKPEDSHKIKEKYEFFLMIKGFEECEYLKLFGQNKEVKFIENFDKNNGIINNFRFHEVFTKIEDLLKKIQEKINENNEKCIIFYGPKRFY